MRRWLTRHGFGVRIVGRTALLWFASFVVLSGSSHDFVVAAGLAGLAALVWSVICQQVFAAARVKRLAFGRAASTAVGIVAGSILLAAATFVVAPRGFERLTLLAIATLGFVVVTTWERGLDRLLGSRRRLLIVGANPWGIEILEAIAAAPKSEFDVIGLIDDDREVGQIAGVPIQGRTADLAEVVKRERPDLVVIASERSRPDVFSQLLEVAGQDFSVVGLPEFYEHTFGRVPIRGLTPAWFMSVLHLYQRPYSRVTKRTFDLAVAVLGIVILAPLFPLIAVLVRMTAGPAIYRQTRLGEGGRLFTIYKFRTMRIDAEAGGHAWATERDPRVTKVGRLLRKTRLDEIPQLWNVLRGDMSIVGPRPERPEYLELLSDAVPFWTSRHLIKPGITGWAQVSDGYADDFESTERKLSYDLWYLRHRSFAIDLLVCAKTVSKLSSGSGGR